MTCCLQPLATSPALSEGTVPSGQPAQAEHAEGCPWSIASPVGPVPQSQGPLGETPGSPGACRPSSRKAVSDRVQLSKDSGSCSLIPQGHMPRGKGAVGGEVPCLWGQRSVLSILVGVI